MKVIKDYPEVHKYLAEGSYLCDGQEIPYQVISEETILGSESGEAEAAVFSFSYFRKDVENAQERPVIFVFNGGPGSSSVWLHLGLMAPRRLYLKDDVHPETVPPFQMVDNQECLLDTCDLVMIDPVETGYSRLLKEDAADKYFGLNQDAHSVAVMIRDWLVRYDRFNSPKYLLCESYGTIRSALLMNELTGGCFSQDGRLAAISLNGVFMLGTALIIPGYEKMPELYHEVYQMLAWAAVNWYHHPEGKPELEVFVDEAWKFAGSEYLMALFAGNNCSEEEMTAVCEKLEYYTGVSAEHFRETGLHLDNFEFSTHVLKKEKLDVGIYDGRYTMPHMYDLQGYDTVADDPAMGQYVHSFVAAMNAIAKKQLGIENDLPYYGINFKVNEKWDFENVPSPLENLRRGLRRHRNLKVFFGSGLYDLCTHPGMVRYMASHYDLPKEQMVLKEYASGHMPYLGDESRQKMVADIREFIEDTK